MQREFYPNIEPYNTFQLKVSDIHEIYVEESGNPEGKPIIFLHGGPGSPTKGKYRCFFNPEKYRIVLFDQRGCGKSTPEGELIENTTPNLIEDINSIRKHLGIDSWVVFGGSWGSALALVYAQKYPENVKGLVLRGITLLNKCELHWLVQDGMKNIFPDLYDYYIAPLSEKERKNIPQTYYDVFTSNQEKRKNEFAKAFMYWNDFSGKIECELPKFEDYKIDNSAVNYGKIFYHYVVNNCFINEDQIISNIEKIRKIPAVIIHGRYDAVCPLSAAFNLHKAWPEADFHIIPDAGHSYSEPGTLSKLIEYSDKFSDL